MYTPKITMTKDINEDTKEWKEIPCSGLKDLILVKCPHHPNQSTEPMQNSLIFFNVFIYFWRRERERQNLSGGGAEIEGDTEFEAASRL